MTPDATPSPAERYARSRLTTRPGLQAFQASLTVDLDPFQLEACARLEDGDGVLVAAPTGAGKTIVAEFAIFLALRTTHDKVFYTAPMKAISNQKYQEFAERFGAAEVGLLTGDTSINPRARIVVMTTEVLRNMIYADSDLLDDLGFVVMDEVHYLADRFRGAVWEEIIIHLSPQTRLVALSATVSNAEEFGDWIQTVRGDTAVIVSEHRPVPLEQHALFGTQLIDLFDGDPEDRRVNPELVQLNRGAASARSGRGRGRRSRQDTRERRGPRIARAPRWRVVDILEQHDLLPAIFFVFSRAGCDDAVEQVLRSGIELTTPAERERTRAIVNRVRLTLTESELSTLGFWGWRDALERGVAAHHAGMLPQFKSVVEELFQERLLKVVFATETLALGVNMPARTVVLERLDKFNGESRVPITPGEYTQLTGRAGRRGIDAEGHAVVQWRDSLAPEAVAQLASRRSYPLTSSFRPSYNMAINLIERFGRDRSREILESSFAQFQADRQVVGVARKVREQERTLDGYREAMQCHLGDFTEYIAIRSRLSDAEKRLGRTRNRGQAQELQAEIDRDRRRLKTHPCHACSEREDHARWANRWNTLSASTAQLRRDIAARTGAVAAVFDRVTEVLHEAEYLITTPDGEVEASHTGRMLARIYGERDLLVAEALRRHTWRDLDPASLAAMAACMVYEPRRDDDEVPEQFLPKGAFREALATTVALWERLDGIERAHRLPGTAPVNASLAPAMHRWSRGGDLDDVLRRANLAAGDFVRMTKQTIDLLDQIAQVAPGGVGRNARTAVDSLRRGIVASSSL
ncbi:DEAD/DEAH box helicase [Mycetocola reblochoni]|uniref:DEAD/DEAH box helicase n=2 Tax=Mycetocola reblochoni TaxID=331618 RepID=A0A3L6ZNV0_9MICO|nr:DEAD/DEAH box helicase [Mycetocola reblochoni]RLP69593.1 DEAD/DEAH box helicase [Mycetocola reblochoni]SJN27472.1 putative helicase [Mycetocola reblochoni REB411]